MKILHWIRRKPVSYPRNWISYVEQEALFLSWAGSSEQVIGNWIDRFAKKSLRQSTLAACV